MKIVCLPVPFGSAKKWPVPIPTAETNKSSIPDFYSMFGQHPQEKNSLQPKQAHMFCFLNATYFAGVAISSDWGTNLPLVY